MELAASDVTLSGGIFISGFHILDVDPAASVQYMSPIGCDVLQSETRTAGMAECRASCRSWAFHAGRAAWWCSICPSSRQRGCRPPI